MINLKNVTKFYNSNGIVTMGLHNINLELYKNDIVAITGESGSGKSTLLNVICGVDTYEEGEILFNGQETSYFNQDDMDNFRKKHVSFIYQNYNIIDSYTVLENVMIPLLINGYNEKEAKERATELINRVGLEKRIKNKGSKLSGGEKQRCVIARALATDSEILACDEPTGNLDEATGNEIIKLIKEVSKDKLVLLVTHNYEQVKDICTRTIRISDGEIVDDEININVDHEEVIEEPKKEDIEKMSRKTCYRFALYNMKNTPKKNIIVYVVFLLLSLVGLLLFISSSNQAKELSQSDTFFQNTSSDRFIITNNDHTPLDVTKFSTIKGDIVENAFYEDVTFEFTFETVSNGWTYSSWVYATVSNHLPSDAIFVRGNANISTRECIVVIPTSKKSYYSDLVNANGKLSTDEYWLKIRGVCYSDSISNVLLYTNETPYFAIKSLSQSSYTRIIKNDDYVSSESFMMQMTNNYSITEPTLYLSRNYTKEDIEKLKSIKIDVYSMYYVEIPLSSINVEKSSLTYDYFVVPDIGFLGETYELVVYTNQDKALKNICKENGYECYDVDKLANPKSSVEYFRFIIFVVADVIIMFILFFLSYVIVSRIFLSRKNDYAILRSLGFLKNDMKKVVKYEVVTEVVGASILATGGFYIVAAFVPKIKAFSLGNNIYFMIAYFVAIFVLGLWISKLFNNKLFKSSLIKTMKEEK